MSLPEEIKCPSCSSAVSHVALSQMRKPHGAVTSWTRFYSWAQLCVVLTRTPWMFPECSTTFSQSIGWGGKVTGSHPIVQSSQYVA